MRHILKHVFSLVVALGFGVVDSAWAEGPSRQERMEAKEILRQRVNLSAAGSPAQATRGAMVACQLELNTKKKRLSNLSVTVPEGVDAQVCASELDEKLRGLFLYYDKAYTDSGTIICEAIGKVEGNTIADGKSGFVARQGKRLQRGIVDNVNIGRNAAVRAANAIKKPQNDFQTDIGFPKNETADPQKINELCTCATAPTVTDPAMPAQADAAKEALSAQCEEKIREINDGFGEIAKSINDFERDMTAFRRKLMIGGAIVGAGAVAYKISEDKKDEKKKKKRAAQELEDYNNGVITVNGEKKACFTEENYTSLECRDTLARVCQSEEHEKKSGCMAFNGFYCGEGSEGQNTNYCLYQAATSYCGQHGAVVKDAPACQWVATRPDSCRTDGNHLNCLLRLTEAQLQEKCGMFSQDPVCKASQTRIVNQPDAMAEADRAAASEPQVGASDTGGTSLSSLIGGGGLGYNVKTNVWKSNSDILQKLYNSGQLRGASR